MNEVEKHLPPLRIYHPYPLLYALLHAQSRLSFSRLRHPIRTTRWKTAPRGLAVPVYASVRPGLSASGCNSRFNAALPAPAAKHLVPVALHGDDHFLSRFFRDRTAIVYSRRRSCREMLTKSVARSTGSRPSE
jgi:hypothetical protein